MNFFNSLYRYACLCIYKTTHIHSLHPLHKFVISVEDQLRSKLPLFGLSLLEVIFQLCTVLLIGVLEAVQAGKGLLYFLYCLLHFTLEDFCRVQEVAALPEKESITTLLIYLKVCLSREDLNCLLVKECSPNKTLIIILYKDISISGYRMY